VQPNYAKLAAIPARGFIVTSRSKSNEFDFVSRFFAPGVGVNEDPVTGSAHCTLAPFWEKKLGKKDMIACQLSARGGVIKVETAEDRILLSGQAVTIMQGELKEAAINQGNKE
jgi:predicted PhzF superfamily epimerase YddE/YHI9